MPNRVIREGLLTSERINELPWPAECFFYRLMLRADDFGRYDARPAILRASLYPLRINQVREADITRWMAECQKAGLIVLYETDGKRFLEIPKFDQRLRAKKSKWPTCDGQVSDISPSPAHGGENRESESRIGVENGDGSPPSSAEDEAVWLLSLGSDPAYQGIDVPREHAKMARWCSENHKEPTRRRFINWLNRADKPLNGAHKKTTTESNRNVGTANEGKSSQYAGVGKVR